MTPTNLDQALIDAYVTHRIPADRFYGDVQLTASFVADVRARAGRGDLRTAEVMKRLLTLRKTGRLPRLEREYHGRNVSDN